MQVSVETKTGLERTLRIEIPVDTFQSEIEKRLNEMAPKVKLDGFRQGKVPKNVVRQKFGKDICHEAANKLVQETLFKAIDQESLKPAALPSVEYVTVEENKPFIYTATFEVLPDITLVELDGVEVEQYSADVTEEDLEKTIKKLREQHADWTVVERACANGDRVKIDFDGKIGDEPLEGGQAEGFDLELGAKSMIPGFEEGIVGAKAGDELTLNLKFPEEYHHNEIAGKDVTFAIKVHQVEAADLPELDAELAKKLGVESGDVEELKDKIKKNMLRQLEQQLKGKNKNAVFDKITELNSVTLPQAFVNEEIRRMKNQMFGGQKELAANLDKLPNELFSEQAEKNVRTGLVLSEVVSKYDLKADDERVKQHIEDAASDYQDPEEFVQYYYSDKDRLSQVENIVLEDIIVEKLLASAKVTTTVMTFDEVMNPKAEEA